jgi:hypothetical protein
MPNWCNNNLTIQAKGSLHMRKNKLTDFMKSYCSYINDKENDCMLDFEKIIPIPNFIEPPEFHNIANESNESSREQYENSKKKAREQNKELYGYESWYDFCNEVWGTKWNSSPIFTGMKRNVLYFIFDTAWSPPYGIMEKLIADNPHLSFELNFSEIGMGFQGIITGNDGVVTENRHWDFNPFEDENDNELRTKEEN